MFQILRQAELPTGALQSSDRPDRPTSYLRQFVPDASWPKWPVATWEKPGGTLAGSDTTMITTGREA